MLIASEPWANNYGSYQPYGFLDFELGTGIAPQLQTLGVEGKPNLHFNKALVERQKTQTGARIASALDRFSGADPRSSNRQYTDKKQMQVEQTQYRSSPVMYLIDPQAEDVETIRGPNGFSIPSQPYAFYDHAKGHLTLILRSLPANQLRLVKGQYMNGVFLKSYQIDMNKNSK